MNENVSHKFLGERLMVVIGVLTFSSGAMFGNPHHLKYETDTEVYEVTYDDRWISDSDMQKLIWLSPYLPPDIPGPYVMAGGVSKHKVDKIIMPPMLDDCSPWSGSCKDPGEPMDLGRAARNVQRGKDELIAVKKIRAPEVLGPVLDHLTRQLAFLVNAAEVQFRYLQTGDTAELKHVLCSECSCPQDEATLRGLGEVKNLSDRLTSSNSQWFNRVLACHDQRNSSYPVSAWQAFTREFKITDTHRFRHVE